jgi:hypothetical protein
MGGVERPPCLDWGSQVVMYSSRPYLVGNAPREGGRRWTKGRGFNGTPEPCESLSWPVSLLSWVMGRVNELGAGGASASHLDCGTFLFGYCEVVHIRRLCVKAPRG